MYCSTCGKKIESEKAMICLGCGCAVGNYTSMPPGNRIIDPHYAAYPPGAISMLPKRIAWLLFSVFILCLLSGGIVLSDVIFGYGNFFVGSGCGIASAILGVPLLITAFTMTFVLLYRSWAVIQDGQARTTPGRAVGYCFIPFFNFAWIFIALIGLVSDMKDYRLRFGLAHVLPPSLGLAIVVSVIGIFWPFIWVEGIPLILWLLFWIPFGFSISRFAEAVQMQRIQTGKVVILNDSLQKPPCFWNAFTISLLPGIVILQCAVFVCISIVFSNENLNQALGESNYKGARLALMFGADINYKNHRYPCATPLFNAVRNNDVETAKWILLHDVDVNQQANGDDWRGYNEGETALWHAVRHGHPEMVKLLIAHGANVDIENKEGNPPLSAAKSEEIKRILIEAGAKESSKKT